MCSIRGIKPVKIQIQGDYWDSQIYKNRLFLWKMDGSITVINWEELIEDLIKKNEKNYSLAIESAFKNSDNLYSDKDMSMLLSAFNFSNDFKRDLEELSNREFVFDESDLIQYTINEIENPFEDMPTDVDIYYDTFYSLLDSGLWKIRLNFDNNDILDESLASKLWDCPLLSLKVKNGGRIGLSGGEQGVYEYEVYPQKRFGNESKLKKIQEGLFQLADIHSLFVNWSYSSVYSSSDIEGALMSAFEWNKDKRSLSYIDNISQNVIFNDDKIPYLSWASDDKIYRATDTGVDIIRFIQSNLKENNYRDAFTDKQAFDFQPWKGKIISAGVGLFGNIVECENALVVMQSNNEFYNIEGPITRWRVFPRSIRYENHLHVILDDRLEIYSFNSDYFVDQSEKVFGMKRYFGKRKQTRW